MSFDNDALAATILPADVSQMGVSKQHADNFVAPNFHQFLQSRAHAGSRTRVTSMGGLYDAATLHALLHHVAWRKFHGMRDSGERRRRASQMDTLGLEPRASRMLSGCDTTTPCAHDISAHHDNNSLSVLPTFP